MDQPDGQRRSATDRESEISDSEEEKRLRRGDRPIPDSYWVKPGRLLAGEYPGAADDAAARCKLQRLLAAGITFFLDLTEADEYGLKPYAPLLAGSAVERMARAAEHCRMPIPDMGRPAEAEMARILDTIDTALAAGNTVYVHCFGGIGRTGTVVGCYLARKGLVGQAALEEIARLRQSTPDGWRQSPETEAQRKMVLAWPAGR